MTPMDRKHALERAGYTQSDIARMRGKSRTLVCNVIKGKDKSAPTMKLIAKILGKSVPEIWPEHFRKGKPAHIAMMPINNKKPSGSMSNPKKKIDLTTT